MDTRPLAPLLDDSGAPGAICDLAVSFGAVCEACSDDMEPYCLGFYIDELTAMETSGTLVERTAADIAADETCD